MKIAEVSAHIGEEWYVAGPSYGNRNGRARIDGIETRERKVGYGYNARNVRYVLVTWLDDTGQPRLRNGEPFTGLVPPKDITEPWADWAERHARRLAGRERRHAVHERLSRHLGEVLDPSSQWGAGVKLTVEQAERIVDRLDHLGGDPRA